MEKMIVHYFMERNKVCWSMETTHQGLCLLQKKAECQDKEIYSILKKNKCTFPLFLAEESSDHVTQQQSRISIKLHFRYSRYI